MDGGCFGDGGRNKESVAEEEVLTGVAENGETDGEKGCSGGGRRYSATEVGGRTPGGGDSDGSRETEKKRGRAGEGGGHGGRGGGRGSSNEGEGSSDGGKVSAKREIGRLLCFAEEEIEREREREREREEVELRGGGAGGRRPTVGNDGVKCGREDERRKKGRRRVKLVGEKKNGKRKRKWLEVSEMRFFFFNVDILFIKHVS